LSLGSLLALASGVFLHLQQGGEDGDQQQQQPQEENHVDRYARARVTTVFLWFGLLCFGAMVGQVTARLWVQRLYQPSQLLGSFSLFGVYYWATWLFGLLLTDHNLRVSGTTNTGASSSSGGGGGGLNDDSALLQTVLTASLLVLLPIGPMILLRWVKLKYCRLPESP
jgi:hypothetical protein